MGDPFLISRVRLPFALPEKTLSGNEKPKFFKEVLDISSRAETLLASPAFPSGCVQPPENGTSDIVPSPNI